MYCRIYEDNEGIFYRYGDRINDFESMVESYKGLKLIKTLEVPPKGTREFEEAEKDFRNLMEVLNRKKRKAA